MEKTGHFNIKKAIKKYNAILGGEMSGHIFINHDWYGFDDAIYTAVMLAKVISDTGQTVSSVIEQFPKTFTTPELNLDVDDVSKFKMVEKFKEQMKFPDAEFNTIDGVRVSIGSSWGLMRASNTSPKLVFRFEAESKKDLEKIRRLFALNLKNITANVFPFELPPVPAMSDFYTLARGSGAMPDGEMPSMKSIGDAAAKQYIKLLKQNKNGAKVFLNSLENGKSLRGAMRDAEKAIKRIELNKPKTKKGPLGKLGDWFNNNIISWR